MWSKPERGFTLVEMILAIVVLGVGLAGVLLAFQQTTRGSADPLVQRQLLALAEGMLEEVLSKPFAAGAGSGGTCRSGFDDMVDYNGYAGPICVVGQAGSVASLAGYQIAVVVQDDVLAGVNARRVTVTASRSADQIQLVGWRTGYAP